jgi:uncharacterized repeat protein (TIGR03803 family)
MPSKTFSIATKASLTIIFLGFLVFATAAVAQQEHILAAFTNGGRGGSQPAGALVFNANGNDGYFPQSGLIIDSAGNLYGTTIYGGRGVCSSTFPFGCGTVFELARTAEGNWREKILHEFGPGEDGPYPNGGLIFDASGDLYGVTSGIEGSCGHGLGNCGAVYELMPSTNGQWTEKILHHFSYNTADGYGPAGSLTFDKAGNLYGGTEWGGANFDGIAFELSPNRDGSWGEKVLYTYYWGKGENGGGNGSFVFDASGNLFNTTLTNLTNGYNGPDVVFELSPSGGSWTQTTLDVQQSDLASNVPLVFDTAGNLYGTARYGGTGTMICLTLGVKQTPFSCGTVFKLAPAGGTWTETSLHDFGNGTDGQIPMGGLVFDSAGHLFGTTFQGGPAGGGTVFEVTLQ